MEISVVWPVVVVLSFALNVMDANDSTTPTLSCAETAVANLVPINISCDLSKEDVRCVSDKDTQRTIHILFHVSEPVEWTKNISDTSLAFCLAMSSWTGGILHSKLLSTLDFSDDMNAAVMIVEKKCWTITRENCSIQVLVRTDVMELPPLAFRPNEADFWNFSSPMLQVNHGWLNRLILRGGANNTYPGRLRGLAGSSVTVLVVDGYFGADNAGPIPAINNLPRLYVLALQYNGRRKLTADDFNGTTNIQYFQLDGNQFDEFPSSFSMLKILSELTIQDNIGGMKILPENLVGSSIENLMLSGTFITNWPVNFPMMPKLLTLNLANCGISTLDTIQFKFPKLGDLDLSENKLFTLPANTFNELSKLESLRLNNNFIHEIHPQTFVGLPILNEIDLSVNNLTNWPVLHPHKFKTISIWKNQLTNIVNIGTQGLTVHDLDISQNNISHWQDSQVFVATKPKQGKSYVIQSLGINATNTAHSEGRHEETGVVTAWVKRVNLSRNHIAIFSQPMMDSLNVLDQVDLGGNEIDCGDCESYILQRWLNAAENTIVLDLNTAGPLTCSHPDDLKDQSILVVPFDKMCLTPNRRVWLGLGLPLIFLVGTIVTLTGTVFYYRTEVAYLAHLAKVRANSKKKDQYESCCNYDVFICYSGKNRKWVLRRLVRLLERPPERYRLCLFDRDFRLGAHIVTNIVDAVEQSSRVIVVLTEHFIASKWCQWELEMANHKLFSEDPNFLVLLELESPARGRLPRLLRFLLDTRPVVRWPRPETEASVLAAAARMRQVLGPSLRQRRDARRTLSATHVLEPQEDRSIADERTPLLQVAEPVHR